MINLFPAHYLQPPRIAGSDGGSDASDDENDTDDESEEASDDRFDDYTDDADGSYAGADPPGVYLEKSQGMRNAFLREFSDDEVAEMWQVHNFMIFASGCARNAATQGPRTTARGSV